MIFQRRNNKCFIHTRCGQERFRSIAKSYFRRADGVVLMYDCTYEKSFLNVRDWVNVIMDSSDKRLPIVLIGNKTDLREQERKNRKVVEFEDGKRLADVIKKI